MSDEKWRALYRDAVLETNFDKLLARIHEGEKAIAERIYLDSEVSTEDRRALHDARNSLAVLRHERTGLHTHLDRNK